MAQADVLVKLLKSAANNDQLAFRKAAEELIQEESSKGHRVLAERLQKSLLPDFVQKTRASTSSFDNNRNSVRDLIFEKAPDRSLDSLFLPDKIQAQVRELAEEQHRRDLLIAHNLLPRNRVLIAGPPGNGKTSLAEALANELMYPLITIRYETLVGSYLGETASRLMQVLDYARAQRCVLFFDEFETLGKERGDTHETGEIKRVVSSLLLQLDALPDYVVVVAASNHPELLDRAVWRRFQLRIALPNPSREQLTSFIDSISSRTKTEFGLASETIAKHLAGANFSEVEEFCLGIVRRAILDRTTENARPITKLKIEQWKARLSPTKL